jgi:hypothetical protein
MMYAERADGSRWLVPIEWKYTEHYGNDNKAADGVAADPINGKGAVRQRRYTQLIQESEQLKATDIAVYYFEPFYQLMRQTLLAEQIVRHRNEETLRADGFLHLHVIPSGNVALRRGCTGVVVSIWKPHGAGSWSISRDIESLIRNSCSRRWGRSQNIRGSRSI